MIMTNSLISCVEQNNCVQFHTILNTRVLVKHTPHVNILSPILTIEHVRIEQTFQQERTHLIQNMPETVIL